MTLETSYAELVEKLGSDTAAERWATYRVLVAAGDAAAEAVREGLSHPDWRVRRGCALWADHNPEPSVMERLRLTLHDPKAKVRMFAVHAMGCEPCKPGGNPVDAVPLLIQAMEHDKAPRVRRMAVAALIQQPPERRVVRALKRCLERETDARTLKIVAWRLRRWAKEQAGGPHPRPLSRRRGRGE